MSSLLQNVLASRLAQATLGSGSADGSVGSSSDASHEGTSSTSRMESTATYAHDGRHEEDWEQLENPGDVPSDEELIGVLSAPGTVPGTPHISRPSSPSLLGPRASSAKRSALSRTITASGGNAPRKSKTDPLRSLPRECMGATLDAGNANASVADAAAGPATWTRRASKTDWKTQYAKRKRMEAREQQRIESLPGSGAVTPSRSQRIRDEGHRTISDMRQDEWQAQREAEEAGFSKNEMREWYKTQGGNKGGKLKGKRNKGGVKTATENSSLWE